MRRPLPLAALALALCARAAPAAAQSGSAGEVIALVNALRSANGLPAYQVDPALLVAAQQQADWNAANGFSSHTGQGGSSPNQRAQAAGYGGGARAWATENIAQGTLPYITPAWVVQLWQGDDVHLRAMLSPDFQHVGVGYAEAGGDAYYSMVVGYVSGQPLPPAPAQSDGQAESAPAPPAPTPVTLATPRPDGSIVHVVAEGQSFWVIAAWYDLDVEELLALNGLSESVFLHAGDELLIRPPDPPTQVAEAASPTATAQAPPGRRPADHPPAPRHPQPDRRPLPPAAQVAPAAPPGDRPSRRAGRPGGRLGRLRAAQRPRARLRRRLKPLPSRY